VCCMYPQLTLLPSLARSLARSNQNLARFPISLCLPRTSFTQQVTTASSLYTPSLFTNMASFVGSFFPKATLVTSTSPLARAENALLLHAKNNYANDVEHRGATLKSFDTPVTRGGPPLKLACNLVPCRVLPKGGVSSNPMVVSKNAEESKYEPQEEMWIHHCHVHSPNANNLIHKFASSAVVNKNLKKGQSKVIEKRDEAPLVLLHGYGVGSGYMYRSFFRLGNAFTNVYACDLLGFGLSSRNTCEFLKKTKFHEEE
jgi:hypothetical protein